MEESTKVQPTDVTLRYEYEGDIMSLEWWQKNILYHVYLPSFKDSNSDGTGDFEGLISKLDYFDELNIKTLLLSPFYPSPQEDNGYDISDFVGIEPIFGSMEDFDRFIAELKRRDMNVIVDLVCNHTSDQHEWFKKSINKEEPYSDYFIWADEKPTSTKDKKIPPNNWLSVFGGSAWTWNEQRQQFYFHQFLKEQPDLNFRNMVVVDEIKKVMTFWLEKGVDGFRIDAAPHIYEDKDLRDEPVNKKSKAKPDEHDYLDHIYTKGQKETYWLLGEFRKVLNEYSDRTGKPKIMIVEAFDEMKKIMDYYGDDSITLADFPFNFQLYKVTSTSTGLDIYDKINIWLSNMPKGKYPNWVLSSHDDPRLLSRIGRRLGNSLQIMTMFLPGLPCCYYGDEIGMVNTKIKPEEVRDKFALRTSLDKSRDPMRTPMQWNAEKYAGFTDAEKPWLPVNENYTKINVESERNDPASFLNMYKQLLMMHDEPTVLVGLLEFTLVNEEIFSFLRFLVDAKCYLYVLNASTSPVCADLSNSSPYLPKEAVLELSNGHVELSEIESIFKGSSVPGKESDVVKKDSKVTKKDSKVLKCKCKDKKFLSFTDSIASSKNNSVKISLSAIHLQPREAVVLSFIGKKPA